MKRIKFRGVSLVAVVAAMLLLAACSKNSTSSSGGASTAGSGSSGMAGAISTGNVTGLGKVLTGPGGMTLYLFTPEQGGTPACTGSCAATWPAVLVPSGTTAATATGGVKSSMLGTVPLSDGQMEVTYNNWPLHTYAGDSAPGQANGQGLNGKWFAVTPSGNAAGSSASSGSSGTTGGTTGGGSSGSAWG